MQGRAPLIGVIADRRLLQPHVFHLAGEKYLRAVADGAGGLPVILAVLPGDFDAARYLPCLDGLLLTGSPSNLEPGQYGGAASAPGTLHDPARDTAALALIPAALRAGLPLLAICRGFQEMNVALGGTLHQAVHELPGALRHHEDKNDPVDVQYAPSHSVSLRANGLLDRLAGRRTAMVNSVHSQGVDRLADGLEVEATAPDGLIEAFTVRDAPGFSLGVQWHPEWDFDDNGFYAAIFSAFGEACEHYRNRT